MTTTPASAPLGVYLFGEPHFSARGAPYRFASLPRALPLLAYLVLHRQGPVPREKVAFTIWEDDPEEVARANLRRHLHHVQRALPPAPDDAPWILAEGDTLQWNPASGAWTDVADFERLAASAKDRAAAVELYAGDLLASSYEEWLFADRDRLRAAFIALLSDLVLECRGTRDLTRAAHFAQRMLAADPWREDAVRQLMAVRYESGDRGGAIAAYQQFERRLRDEMGVEPMPETAALRDLVLRNAPLPVLPQTQPIGSIAADDIAHAIGSEVRPTPALPFVGREREMESLRQAWQRAVRGQGGLVLIGGEAGIGKSRLAWEFALHAETQGARLLTGATSSPEGAPFQPVVQALRGAAPLLVSLDVPRVWLGVASQAVTELSARLPDLPRPPDVDPGRERARLFESFAVCLIALAKARPLVVILEDLQWAGAASIDALQFITRRIVGHQICLVATYREDEAGRTHPLRGLRHVLREEHLLTTIAPRPLDQTAVTALVEWGPEQHGDPAAAAADDTGRPPSDRAAPAALLELTAGNPLFLGEALRDLRESGGRVDAARLPASARQAITHRVQRLDERARLVAEAAAVVGQGFDIELVRDVTGWTEDEVLDGLSGLMDRAIVRESGGRGGFAYAFSHQMVQSTIYAGVAEDVRVRRHRRIARALEDLANAQTFQVYANDIARHHDLGGEREAAAAAYLEAARQTESVYAFDEALGALARCLDLVSDIAVRRDALLLRESICSHRGDRASQRADIDALERIAARTRDDVLDRDIIRRDVLLARALGERERERDLIDELARRAEAAGDAKARAEALVARAAHAALTGRHEEGKHAAIEALAIYQASGDAHGAVEARCRLIEVETAAGVLGPALEVLTDLRRASSGSGDARLLARALTSASHGALVEQRYDVCLDLAGEARDLYRRIGDREGEADATTRLAAAAARLSHFDDALRWYDEAGKLYAQIGKRLGVAAVLANRAIMTAQLGMLETAETSQMSAREQFLALGDMRGQAACAINISFLRLHQHDPAGAKMQARDALALAETMHHDHYRAASLANLGQAERDLGETASAIQHLAEAVAVRRRHGALSDYADDFAGLALAYVVAGDTAAAAAMADELWSALDGANIAVFMPQLAYWQAAQVYRALSDPKRAQATLRKAMDAVGLQAQAITNESLRETFLAFEPHRQIAAAAADKGWVSSGASARKPRRATPARVARRAKR